MKITKSTLKQLIREETEAILNERVMTPVEDARSSIKRMLHEVISKVDEMFEEMGEHGDIPPAAVRPPREERDLPGREYYMEEQQ